MKKILISLDYVPIAQKVAEIGFSLAENKDATITLLHVIAEPSYYGSTVYDPIMGFGWLHQYGFVTARYYGRTKNYIPEFS